MSSPTEITSVSQWNQTLRTATAEGKTVFVDFHAVWCGPCKTIAPKYESLSKSTPQSVFVRVDVDQQRAIASKYQVSSMPTFLAIKSGKVVETIKGADPAGLTRLVKTHSGPNPPVAPLPQEAEDAKTAGNTAFKEGQWEKAIEHYSQAIIIAPESATLHANRSFAYFKNSQSDKALIDARKSVELDGNFGKGYVRLGDAYVGVGGKQAEAKEAYEKSLTLLPASMRTDVQSKLDKLGA
ncbi:thioredoxin h [Phaffia rhodozyma]|uniref:Thioredoxin h n=1 Tax=Phaffia rhodozyma TaxID=264483 RepID=A0A0F7SHP2_PHARH|nr:thioredoxin h [Phaffia rhodozyma]